MRVIKNSMFVLCWFVKIAIGLSCAYLALAAEHSDPAICIIGAGITSAAVSHFLTKTPIEPPPRILVFEGSSKVGGRIRTIELPTKSHGNVKVEAGASIIAGSNRLMGYFADYLNLTRKSPQGGNLGLWDGKSFLLRTSKGSMVRNSLAFVKRYGLSLFRMKRFVSRLLADYDNVYPSEGAGAEWRPSETVEELFHRCAGLYNLSQIQFVEVANKMFNSRLRSELIAAITRVNYGQDPSHMNAFSGAVGLAGSGTDLWAVEGGNVQVVEQLFDRSNAQIFLNTRILNILSTEVDGRDRLQVMSENETWLCDTVVLAAPYETANISLPEEVAKTVSIGRQFQRTHATFVRGYLNEDTFGRDPPDSILTSEGVIEPFTSIGRAWRDVHAQEPPIFKVFSREKLDKPAISRMFQPGSQLLLEFPWLAYPKFNAPERFPSFWHRVKGGHLLYTSPIESAGSAMEMSAVSGANAAALIKQKLGLKLRPVHNNIEKEDL